MKYIDIETQLKRNTNKIIDQFLHFSNLQHLYNGDENLFFGFITVMKINDYVIDLSLGYHNFAIRIIHNPLTYKSTFKVYYLKPNRDTFQGKKEIELNLTFTDTDFNTQNSYQRYFSDILTELFVILNVQ